MVLLLLALLMFVGSVLLAMGLVKHRSSAAAGKNLLVVGVVLVLVPLLLWLTLALLWTFSGPEGF